MGKAVNGNPYWLEKPEIQRISGSVAESDAICAYMRDVVEEAPTEDVAIDSKTLLYDIKNSVLLNVDRFTYKDGVWSPNIGSFRETDMWPKYSILFTAMLVALKNNGVAIGKGTLTNQKTGAIGASIGLDNMLETTYLQYLVSIRTILEGSEPKLISPNHCKRCCYENCPVEAKLGKVTKLENGTYFAPLGEEA